jgi:hypothetical protein
MPACSGSNPHCSDTELSTDFSGTIIPGNLNVNADTGIFADAASLKDVVTSIMNSKNLTPPSTSSAGENNNDAVTAYVNRLNAFFEKFEEEYSYYNARYRYSLNKLIDAIAGNTNNVNNASINDLTAQTKDFNKKLNILIQIAQGISKKASEDAASKGGEIVTMNSNLNTRSEQIKKHSEILKKNLSSSELRKQMVEYTQEKARATENLLSLYFALNVFAIGALIYIYKA